VAREEHAKGRCESRRRGRGASMSGGIDGTTMEAAFIERGRMAAAGS